MEATTDIETIKWLLVAILVGMVVVAISAVVIAVTFWLGYQIIKDQSSGKIFRAIAEDYLAKNENTELMGLVEERLDSHPQDVWAHWYMGQVKYHTGAYTESRRCFERVIELEPGWYSSVESWLGKISQELEKGPQLVE